MGTWLHKKVVEPFLQILSRGAEPKQLAFSTALGITLGVFPIVGVTVFLCGLAIAMLGTSINAPTVMLANFIATPIELRAHFPLTSDALKKVLTGKASKEIFQSLIHALLGWLVLAPVILGVLYIMLVPCFTMLVRKFSSSVSSPKKDGSSITEVMLKVRDI